MSRLELTYCVSLTAVLILLVLGSPPLQAQASSIFFPDYVVGAGWSVQLVLGNHHLDQPASVTVEVYDQQGSGVSEFFDSGNRFEIPPLGSRILKNAGEGDLRRGWIAVRSESTSVMGLLTYRNSETGIEVGVEPVELGDQFALFVEESSDIGTGVAIFKPDFSSEVRLGVLDRDGIHRSSVFWSNFHQRAHTIPEWFDADRGDMEFLNDFGGVLFLGTDGSSGSLFAPLGFRFGKRTGSLSAVPVTRVVIPTVDYRERRSRFVFPDYVIGGGWSVQLVIANLRDPDQTPSWLSTRAAGVVQVYDQQGESIGSSAFFNKSGLFILPSQGSRILTTDGDGETWDALYTISSYGIHRKNLDGDGNLNDEVDVIDSGLVIDLELDSDAGKMYWLESPRSVRHSHRIRRANLDGSQVEDVLSEVGPLGLGEPKQLALDLDGGKMYWWDNRSNKIQRANLDGTQVEDFGLYPGVKDLEAYAGHLYTTEVETTGVSSVIRRTDLSRRTEKVLVSSDDGTTPHDLEFAGNKMYWITYGSIRRANLDGSGIEKNLVSPEIIGYLNALALDPAGGKMYWSDERIKGGTILRANLDGTQIEDLGGGSPEDLELDVGLGPPHLRPGSPIRRGWIQVTLNYGSVGGLLTYKNAQTGIEVGVKPVELGENFALFVEESSDIGTGLAIFKPDSDGVISLQIWDESGNLIGEIDSRENFRQSALTLSQWFEGSAEALPAEFRGLLILRGYPAFAPVGLRFGKQTGSLSAVPVIQVGDISSYF